MDEKEKILKIKDECHKAEQHMVSALNHLRDLKQIRMLKPKRRAQTKPKTKTNKKTK